MELALKPQSWRLWEAPDLGLDKVSAALTYRPTWSNIPSGEEDERNITRLT